MNLINYTSTSFVPILQEYSIEILTTSITFEDNSYFSFVQLFDINVSLIISNFKNV